MVREGVGTDTTQTTKITAIETAIGSNTSGKETGIYKDIKDANTDINEIYAIIGDESDPAVGTIIARIIALEEAANGGEK